MQKIDTLLKDLQNSDTHTKDEFWTDLVKNKTPLVEKYENSENYYAYFFWHGDDTTQNVYLHCGVTGDELTKLERIGNSNYFFVKMELPGELRTLYSFLPDLDKSLIPDVANDDKITAIGKINNFYRPLLKPDPLNKIRQVIYDGDEQTYAVKSVIEMPKAEPQPWSILEPRVPIGTVETHIIKSKILNQDRTIWIHKPTSFNPQVTSGLLLQYDGQCHQLPAIPLPNILDNLTHANKINPMLTVLVDSVGFQSRNNDFFIACEIFFEFIQQELLPWLHKNYNLSSEPKANVVSGESASGFYAFYTGLQLPHIFGNILCNSGTVILSKIKDEILEKTIPVCDPKCKIYMTYGSYEEPELQVLPGIAIHQLLIENNYDVQYTTYCGEHDFVCWQGEIAKGLIHLVGK